MKHISLKIKLTLLYTVLMTAVVCAILALLFSLSGQELLTGVQARLEQETVPALRELLQQDIRHLDEIQSAAASSLEFLLVLRLEEKEAADERGLRQLEKALCDHGIHVQLAEAQDVKRLLAVYYQHDVTTDDFEDVDGERTVTGNG